MSAHKTRNPEIWTSNGRVRWTCPTDDRHTMDGKYACPRRLGGTQDVRRLSVGRVRLTRAVTVALHLLSVGCVPRTTDTKWTCVLSIGHVHEQSVVGRTRPKLIFGGTFRNCVLNRPMIDSRRTSCVLPSICVGHHIFAVHCVSVVRRTRPPTHPADTSMGRPNLSGFRVLWTDMDGHECL